MRKANVRDLFRVVNTLEDGASFICLHGESFWLCPEPRLSSGQVSLVRFKV